MVKIFFSTIKEIKYSLSFVYRVLLFVLISSCSSGPEPLYYKKDSCAFCKMQLIDTKFGAELITEKGKIYKFDDIGCMLDFEQQNLGSCPGTCYRLFESREINKCSNRFSYQMYSSKKPNGK